uniref:preprotein translocase subunit SecE n=1 Tax=Thaumasiovibrio occultus TaxID=1891184 RepID=UPI000B3510A7|nr:preprotein translocase subunit SecE [Thaumasiovibrio occultus]
MKVDTETPNEAGKSDALKWIGVFALLAAIVAGNHLYSDMNVVWRALAGVVLFGSALGVAALTAKGKQFITFARESRMEVRKVVWPTRQEATRMTLTVLAVTVVTALVLWVIDGALVHLIGLFTGV